MLCYVEHYAETPAHRQQRVDLLALIYDGTQFGNEQPPELHQLRPLLHT